MSSFSSPRLRYSAFFAFKLHELNLAALDQNSLRTGGWFMDALVQEPHEAPILSHQQLVYLPNSSSWTDQH